MRVRTHLLDGEIDMAESDRVDLVCAREITGVPAYVQRLAHVP